MLREMADLGFDQVELSHGIRITLVPGILKAVEEGMVRISSVHNFCPLPTGITHAAPNLFEPSARDPREHDQWLRHTRRSLDFAAQVKARAMVTHLGSVRFFWFHPGRKLRAYQRAHPGVDLRKDAPYQRMLPSARARMQKRLGPFWERTRQSLAEIRDYAVEKNVVLGLENREKFEELPVDADFPAFLTALGTDYPGGYWHDTGHAQLKEELGLHDHRRLLEENADRLVGFHLHDVNAEGQDHQPVGSGHIDFNMVSTFWRPHHLLVLELSPRVEPGEVSESKARIEALIG